jgi:hypothetical protein
MYLLKTLFVFTIIVSTSVIAQVSPGGEASAKEKCELQKGMFDNAKSECKCAGKTFDLKTHSCVLANSSLEIFANEKVPDCSKNEEKSTSIFGSGIDGTIKTSPVGKDGGLVLSLEVKIGGEVRMSKVIVTPGAYGASMIGLSDDGYSSGGASLEMMRYNLMKGIGVDETADALFVSNLDEKIDELIDLESLKNVDKSCTSMISRDGRNLAKMAREEFSAPLKGVCLSDEPYFMRLDECKCSTGEYVNLGSKPQKCPDFNKSTTPTSKTSVAVPQ